MKQELNLTQTCIAAVAFLDKEYFTHYSDELPCCVGDLALYRGVENWQEEPQTWDPAAWGDWLDVAKTVLNTDVSKDTRVSLLQAYRIMRAFVDDYACRLNYADMKKLSIALDDTNIAHFQDSELWKYWLLCVRAALENKTEPSGGLVSCDTLVSQKIALEIMQDFLRDYCLTVKSIKNNEWFRAMQELTLEGSSADPMLNDWLASYREVIKNQDGMQEVNIHQARYIMFLFIMKQENKMQPEDFKNLSAALQLKEDEIQYSTFYAWMHAAYAVIYKNI